MVPVTTQLKAWLADSDPSVAVTVTLWVPSAPKPMVPVMRPFAEPMLRPVGRPEAE